MHCDVIIHTVMHQTFVTRLGERCPAQKMKSCQSGYETGPHLPYLPDEVVYERCVDSKCVRCLAIFAIYRTVIKWTATFNCRKHNVSHICQRRMSHMPMVMSVDEEINKKALHRKLFNRGRIMWQCTLWCLLQWTIKTLTGVLLANFKVLFLEYSRVRLYKSSITFYRSHTVGEGLW